jgi:Stress responsive A/B Barrel Domain
MIRHIVLVRFRADVPPTEIEAIAADLQALVGRLDGFVACHGGPDVNFEGMERGYRHGFVLDFADQTARLRYHHAAEHQPISARLVAA